jgi:hypothetical protein
VITASRRCILWLVDHLDWLVTVEYCITVSGLLSVPVDAIVLRALMHRSLWAAPAEFALLLLLLMRVAVNRSDHGYVTRLKRSSGWKWTAQILQLSLRRLHVDELSVNDANQCMLVIDRRRRKLPRFIMMSGVELLAAINLLRLMGPSYYVIVIITAWCLGIVSLIATAIVTSLLFGRAGRLISAASGES